MFNGIYFLSFLAAGIVLGIAYRKLLAKICPDNKRKPGYFPAVVIFVGASLSIYAITSVKPYLNSTVIKYSATVEKYVNENFADNEIVMNGVSLNQLNEMIGSIDSGKDMVISILPDGDEMGALKFFYGIGVNYIGGYIDTYITALKQNSADALNKYGDNGHFTVSSIINGLSGNLINEINRRCIIILIIVNIPFYIYIISTLIPTIKALRKSKNDAAEAVAS